MLLKSKVFLIIVYLFCTTNVFADTKCFDTLNRWVPDDGMIKVVHLTEDSLNIYINNIRNMKDVDIKGYGFDDNQAKQLETKYNCPKTSFIKAYDEYGIPKVIRINGKLLKDFADKSIVN